MKTFQRGQIWLVNFDPSFGHEYKKIRPGLIVQNNEYIRLSQVLTIIPITSKIAKKTKLDILIKKDSENRLMKNSLIKIKQISSFDKRRFLKHIGNVNENILEQVADNICLFLI
jgi:mRNA interferase MazF